LLRGFYNQPAYFLPSVKERERAKPYSERWPSFLAGAIIDFANFVRAAGAHVVSSGRAANVMFRDCVRRGMTGVVAVWPEEFANRNNTHSSLHLGDAQWDFAVLRNIDCRRCETCHALHRGACHNSNHHRPEVDMVKASSYRVGLELLTRGSFRHLRGFGHPGPEFIELFKHSSTIQYLRAQYGKLHTYAEGDHMDEEPLCDEPVLPLPRAREVIEVTDQLFESLVITSDQLLSKASTKAPPPLDRTCVFESIKHVTLPHRPCHLNTIQVDGSYEMLTREGPRATDSGDTTLSFVRVFRIIVGTSPVDQDDGQTIQVRRCWAQIQQYQPLADPSTDSSRIDPETGLSLFSLADDVDTMSYVPVTWLLSPLHMVHQCITCPESLGPGFRATAHMGASVFLHNHCFIKRSS